MPAFVVELGLNYKVATHLKPDHDKLLNSGYSKGGKDRGAYLVHLWQPHRGIKDKKVVWQGLNAFISTAGVGVAVVVFTNSHIWVKHLSDKVITETPI